MFWPLYWAIIRSTVFQRKLCRIVFIYVISTNEISLFTWPMSIVKKRKEKPSNMKGNQNQNHRNKSSNSRSQKTKYKNKNHKSNQETIRSKVKNTKN